MDEEKVIDEYVIEMMNNAMKAAYPALQNIPSLAMFLSVIFTMIDQYAADHDIPTERILKDTRKMCDFQKEAHEVLGTMTKYNEEE